MDAKKNTPSRSRTKKAHASRAVRAPAAAADPAGPAHGAGHAHIMPVKTLLGVWGGLLALTVVTVAIAQVHLGQFNVVVALAVAVVKATLVGLYFMHLKYDTRANRVVLASAAFFVILFIAFVVFDTTQYQPDMLPPADAAN